MDAVVISERGNEKLPHGGFCYVHDKWSRDGSTHFWRCERRRPNCKGRVHTNHDATEIRVVTGHNHDANAAGIEVQIVKNKIKKRAVESQETTAQILTTATEGLSRAGQGQLPHLHAQRKIIQRARTAAVQAPANPRDTTDLVIPQQFTQYNVTADNSVPFLLADSGPEENRILIFGTDAFADIMDRSAVWFGDGTFSITPPLFSQTEATYNRMFDMIKELRPRSLPTEFNCDFESAVIKAASRAFPNCQICGCFFHLVRNVKKHIAQEGLLPRYNTDGDFQLQRFLKEFQCRMISALAFVPIDDLDYAVDDLSLILPPELQPVLSYFEDTYMGRPVGRQRVRRPPTFAPSIWSVHDRTLAGTHRTNNHAEAAHRRIQSEMGVDHPSIWKFVDGLRRVQKGRDNFYESLIRGDQPPVKLRRYRLADERILTVMRDYDTRTTEDFLRGIAHNYEMNP